jgi:electron transfer flavoprotein beta subunit
MRGIMSARTKPLQVIEAISVPQYQSVVNFDKPAPRSQVKLVPGDNVQQLVDLLHTEARVI